MICLDNDCARIRIVSDEDMGTTSTYSKARRSSSIAKKGIELSERTYRRAILARLGEGSYERKRPSVKSTMTFDP